MDAVSATRRSLRAARTMLANHPDRPRWDREIAHRLVDHILSRDVTTVAAYSPLPGEPGGTALIPALTAAGITIWLPHSHPDGVLTWSRYAGDDQMTEGRFHIRVPTTPPVDTLTATGCELIVVPALAVTSDGVRLGQGGGYYDRLIAANPTLPTAVVVWAEEIHDQLPVFDHDARCDAIITNDR